MAKVLHNFKSWESAFGWCREKNHPVTVLVLGKKVKLFPSGQIKYMPKKKRRKARLP